MHVSLVVFLVCSFVLSGSFRRGRKGPDSRFYTSAPGGSLLQAEFSFPARAEMLCSMFL